MSHADVGRQLCGPSTGGVLVERDSYAPGVVVTSTGFDRRRTVSRLAFAIAVLDLLAVTFLIIFYAVGGPF